MDFCNKLHVFRLFSDIKSGKYIIVLNDKNRRKFGLNVNLVSKYVIKHNFYAFVPISFLALNLASITECYRGNYPLINFIMWSALTEIWTIHSLSLLITVFAIIYFSLVYLRLRFTQLNDKIAINLANFDLANLFKLFVLHRKLTKLIEEMNVYLKYIILIIYFMIPLNLIVMLLIYDKSTPFHMKILLSSMLLIFFILLCSVNYMCVSVTSTSTKCYPKLYKLLIKPNLSVNQRLRIQSFIKELLDSPIGFYFYDLFQMNYYEFFTYLCGWITSYLLIKNIMN